MMSERFATMPYTGTIVDTDGEIYIGDVFGTQQYMFYDFDIMTDPSNTGTVKLISILDNTFYDELGPGEIRNSLGMPSAYKISTTETTPQKVVIYAKLVAIGD